MHTQMYQSRGLRDCFKKLSKFKLMFFLLFPLMLSITSHAQNYPISLSWSSVRAGSGIYFNVSGKIAEPFGGMQYVTYKFTNNSNKKVELRWTTELILSNGQTQEREHSWIFKPNQTESMGWTHTESDMIDTKEYRNARITNVRLSVKDVEIIDY